MGRTTCERNLQFWGKPSGASVKFFGAPFFQKRCDLALDLTWAAAKKKPAPVTDAPVRAIATGAAGEAGSLPSQSRLRRASVSAAASVGHWATSHRDVAAPKGGAK